MATLISLPYEILTHVLTYLHPRDIVHVGQTCRHLSNAVRPSNSFLWHAAFLQVFDNPQHSWSLIQQSRKPIDSQDKQQQPDYWFKQVGRRLSALQSIGPTATGSFDKYGQSAPEVIDTILDIIETAKPCPTESEVARGVQPMVDDRRSLNLELLSNSSDLWARLENLIHDCHVQDNDFGTTVPGRPTTRSISTARRFALRSQNASRLHVLYGRTVRERLEHGQKTAVRSTIYNWHTPCHGNDYGPFQKDESGEIDWKIVEASASVMLRHFELGADGQIAIPQGFYYALPYRTLVDPTIPEDWARVTGRWIGTYSFLDYSDLFAYNTGAQYDWDLEDVAETHGDLMILDLKLDPDRKDDPRLQTNLPCSDDLPKLWFSGISRSFDPYGQPRLMINVMGCVSLCSSGREVRWKYVISYRGQEQWVLEGVQPGGVRSGPVFGLWTQWGHDEHAPVGAFMYIPEELCKRQELVLRQ